MCIAHMVCQVTFTIIILCSSPTLTWLIHISFSNAKTSGIAHKLYELYCWYVLMCIKLHLEIDGTVQHRFRQVYKYITGWAEYVYSSKPSEIERSSVGFQLRNNTFINFFFNFFLWIYIFVYFYYYYFFFIIIFFYYYYFFINFFFIIFFLVLFFLFFSFVIIFNTYKFF